jgi:hypothetical protein
MSLSFGRRSTDVPRKSVAADDALDRKSFAADVDGPSIGRVIERAIVLAGLTKQELAHAMGYADQSALSRWISGAEAAQIAKLWAVRALRGALVIAMAEASRADVEVQTVVTLRRVG